jgi:hypothetical protein
MLAGSFGLHSTGTAKGFGGYPLIGFFIAKKDSGQITHKSILHRGLLSNAAGFKIKFTCGV